MSKPLLMPDDLVRVMSVRASQRKLGGCLDKMEEYVGVKGRVLRVYPDGIISIANVPYSFLATDIKLLERPDKPEWMAYLYSVLETRSSSHPLCYCVYNDKNIKEWPPSDYLRSWVRGGYCFQSFGTSLRDYYDANRLFWRFNLKPSPNFKHQKPTKATVNWWITTWWRMGAFPDDVKLKDLKQGMLDMPIRAQHKNKSMYTLPTNRVYLAVSIMRHIHEWYDGIEVTRYLVEKQGMNFWTALSIVAMNPQSSKGHALWGAHCMPATKSGLSAWEKIALHAVLHQCYFDKGRKKDVGTKTFSWWATVNKITKLDIPSNTMGVCAEVQDKVKSFYDLEKFNPKEVKFKWLI